MLFKISFLYYYGSKFTKLLFQQFTDKQHYERASFIIKWWNCHHSIIMIFLLWLSSEIIWWQCNTLFQLETVCDFKTHCTAQSLLALCSLTLLRGFFLQTVPVPRGVCRWCFAAATAAPGAAAWLSPAGAAGLYSYWHSPSTKEAKHRSTFIFFSCYFYHKPKLLYLTVSALSLYNYCGGFFFISSAGIIDSLVFYLLCFSV